ncbi:uncharacterized protein LOC110981176 [Acanthaster planci]|uniref:Uncharacterized protein LOC110981176 n=1 Tax=Acanthaster planci TaxID=133434 RepID=A0A8B7YLS4_ACAPL|nr:uncharacterized protein LOC110981176 [Acanthaster planci]XP_022094213.1 uncharacterized protein LOC110981176 [Acanthaster planci]
MSSISGSRRGSTVSEHSRARSVHIGRTSNSKWLIRTVAEFCQQIAVIYEHFAINLQSLVESFKEQTLSKDGMCGYRWFESAWEDLLEQYAVVSSDYFDLAHNLECGVTNSLQEAAVHKHAFLDDVVHHRDSLRQEMKSKDSNLLKTEKEYAEAWKKMAQDGNGNIKSPNTALCYNKHNGYVLELAGLNKFNESVHATVLPSLSREIERVHSEIADLVIQGLIKHAQLTKSKLSVHGNHMDAVVRALQDIEVSGESVHSPSEKEPRRYSFVKPDHSASRDFVETKLVMNLATGRVLRDKHETLVREVNDLERRINTEKEILMKLTKQHDNIRANQQHAKAAEFLKKIANHKYDLQRSEVFLESKRAQLQLFTRDILSWKLSNGHAVMPGNGEHSGQSSVSSEAKDSFSDLLDNGRRVHCFQEYNFKKPTFCDNCRGLLKGILKQGLRCKLCKANVHHRCQDGIPACKGGMEKPNRVFRRQASVRDIKPLVDKKKLLRRQKSSSELEIPRQYDSNVDPVYEAIKCAASLSNASSSSYIDTSPRPSLVSNTSATTAHQSGSSLSGSHSSGSTNSLFPESRDLDKSKSAPHSPSSTSTRRKILETYGKSMSLDTEPSLRQQHTHGRNSEPSVRSSSPSSNDQDFVALYNFEGMMRDDLSLRAGDRVHVIDKRSTEWWKGELNGECGFFPSFCVTSLKPWEHVVRVTRTYKASQDVKDGIALKKDQVVIQTSNEDGGWVHVCSRKQTGLFPYKYLQPI